MVKDYYKVREGDTGHLECKQREVVNVKREGVVGVISKYLM